MRAHETSTIPERAFIIPKTQNIGMLSSFLIIFIRIITENLLEESRSLIEFFASISTELFRLMYVENSRFKME